MRRKAYCAAAAIASALLFLSSCATESLEELSRPYIQEGYRLSALDAAAVYEEGLENVESPSLYYNLAYSYLGVSEVHVSQGIRIEGITQVLQLWEGS